MLWKMGISQLHHSRGPHFGGEMLILALEKNPAIAPIFGVDFSPFSFTITRVDGRKGWLQ